MPPIGALEEELYKLETKARNIIPVITDEPRATNIYAGDKTAELIAKTIDLRSIINKKLYEVYSTLKGIERAIEGLPERKKYLIRSRYINFKC